MMRDKLKKEEFFRKSLLFTDECISEFEKILPEIMKQDGTKSQRVINGCNALMVYYIKKVIWNIHWVKKFLKSRKVMNDC